MMSRPEVKSSRIGASTHSSAITNLEVSTSTLLRARYKQHHRGEVSGNMPNVTRSSGVTKETREHLPTPTGMEPRSVKVERSPTR